MKKTIALFIFILISLMSLSQEDRAKTDFRKVSGIVVGYDIPKDGLIVSYIGLKYGVISDSEGKFCLAVPINKSVFIEVPICLGNSIYEIKPTEDFIKIQITGIKDKTQKAIDSEKSWAEIKDTLLPELEKIYNSPEYNIAFQNICG